ncbi:outer dynein arm-docking complex subunit 4-like isoform X2 [Biomphalaria glabrata]|uniref:Outer dynein arm-docking complex subunit 4 n=2 Tax=Biomphalaria glabrata TaxID=6526 RepID=A0A9W3A281_BIOGL|nr:outer dynein arm-docking complex subunit 4-like isoform X2 [Biomphalaria glabrata]XP_055881299.1 outer dynein arm-docking complex subunit 4-like isoform X2 [Biomphalaria glabrata]
MFAVPSALLADPGSFPLLKSEAHKLLKSGNFFLAIGSYTKALQLRPDDRICLVRRSKCHLMLGDTAKALQDAEASLLEDKNYHRGMFQKAEALYNAGDFEMALVYYHRGNRLRPELLEFRLGIQKAREAIINCVGTPDRVKLNTTGDLSFFNAQDEKKKRKVFGSACVKRPQQVVRRKKEKPNNEMTIKQMLGDLYGDRQYLEKLLKETDNTSLTGKHINRLVQDGLHYLDTRTEFWQQVKPMYARKYEAILALNRGRQAKTSPYDHIVGELEKVNKLMHENNYEGVLKKCQRVMGTLDSISEVHLPNKMTFKAHIHSIMGNAYLEMGDYVNAAVQHQMDLTIGEEVGIDDAECRALDNLGRVHARNGKYQKAIDVWERKLPKSKSTLETTWLCHEIGRCYLELGQSRSAKEYGERALQSAVEAQDDRWKLHALVLISQAEVKSQRLSSALISFEKAYEVAGLLMDEEAQDAITKAMNEVNMKVLDREIEGGEEVDPVYRADFEKWKAEVGESGKEEQTAPAAEAKVEESDQKPSTQLISAAVPSVTEKS